MNNQELSENNMLSNGVVDTDIKDESNLLNNSDTVSDVQNKVLTTEVTSIAMEEEKTGQKIDVPDPDELYRRAAMSFITNMKHLNDVIGSRNGGSFKISRKGMNRVLNAILQLPQDGLPVTLQGNDEKAAFALGQRAISDRYLITHYHIREESKRLAKEKLEKEQGINNEQQQVAESKENVNDQV